MDTISLEAVLRLKDQGYTKGMEAAMKAQAELAEGTERTSKSITGQMTAANIASRVIAHAFNAITNAVGGAVKRLDTLNNYPKVMQSLGYSAAASEQSINALSDGIEGLPTTLDSIVSSSQRLTASLGDLGDGTKTAIALNNLFLAGGQGAEAAARGLEQYNQMLASGKVDMQSWKTLLEVAPGQMNQLAQSMIGATANQKDLYSALQSGTLTMADLNAEIIRLNTEGGAGFASFSEQARAATGGIGTAWQNVQTAIVKGVANVIQSFDQAAQAAGMPGVAEALNGVKSVITTVFNGIAEAAKFLATNLQTIGSVALTVVAGIAAFKIADKIRTSIGNLSQSFGEAKGRLEAYRTAISKYGSAEKAAQAAAKASKRAVDLRARASRQAEKASRAQAEHLKAETDAEKARAAAAKAGGKNIELNKAATEASTKATHLKTQAEKQAALAEQRKAEAERQDTLATMAGASAEAADIANMSVKNILLNVMSGQLSIAKAAQEMFNRAVSANPIGMIITAITAAISILKVLADVLKSDAQKEFENFISSCKEAAEASKSAREEAVKAVDSADAQAESTGKLVNEVIALANAENKSEAQKTDLKAKIELLNASMEDLNLAYDEETDALNMSTVALKAKAQAYQAQIKYQARQEKMLELSKAQADADAKLAGLAEQTGLSVEDLTKRMEDYRKAGGDAALDLQDTFSGLNEIIPGTISNTSQLMIAFRDLVDEQAKNAETLEKLSKEQIAMEEAVTAAELAETQKRAAIQKKSVETRQRVLENFINLQQGALDRALANGTATMEMLSAKNQETAADLQNTWQNYKDAATNIFDALSGESELSVAKMIENLQKNQQVINQMGDNMSALRDRFASLGLDQALLDQFAEMGPEAAGYVANLASASDGQLQELANTYGQGGRLAWDRFTQGLGGEADAAAESVRGLVTQTETSLREAVTGANWHELSEDVVKGFAEGLQNDSEAVAASKKLGTDSIAATKGELQSNSPSKVYMNIGKDIVTGLTNGLSALRTRPVTILRTMLSDMLQVIRGQVGTFEVLGRNAGNGFANGLASTRSQIMQTAQSIATSVTQTIRKALDERSPSKVLEKLGSFAGKGFAIGLAKTEALVERVSGSIADTVANAVNGSGGSSFSASYAGGGSMEIQSLRAEIRELKDAILSQPIQITSEFDVNGREMARGTATYMRDELNRQDRLNNNLEGNR